MHGKYFVRIVGAMLFAIPLLVGPPASAAANRLPSAVTDSVAAATADPPIFSDDFSTGDFSNWTAHSSRLTIDSADGSPTGPSAHASVTGQSAWASKTLATSYDYACLSANVRLTSGTAVDLIRVRTAGGGPIAKVQVSKNGVLQVRALWTTKTRFTVDGAWHNIELCASGGPQDRSFSLWRDGQPVVSASTRDPSGAIGRIQLGDTSSDTTFDVRFDQVVLDQTPFTDTESPTVPGQPVVSVVDPSSIQVTWAGSTDQTPGIYYGVSREGDANQPEFWPVDDTTFVDVAVLPGTTYTYTVVAFDVFGHESAPSPASEPITVPEPDPPIFSDDFASGAFANWTSVTGMTIDNATGGPAPSALAHASSQRAFAFRTLDAPTMTGCMSTDVDLLSGGGVDLFRLRTASNGPIIKVFVSTGGYLRMRSDFAGAVFISHVPIGSGWHNVELCGVVGTKTYWFLYYDGLRIENWNPDTGTTPIGRIQIGDTMSKTFTANFDNVTFDEAPGS